MSEQPKLELSIWGIRISGTGIAGIAAAVFIFGLVVFGLR